MYADYNLRQETSLYTTPPIPTHTHTHTYKTFLYRPTNIPTSQPYYMQASIRANLPIYGQQTSHIQNPMYVKLPLYKSQNKKHNFPTFKTSIHTSFHTYKPPDINDQQTNNLTIYATADRIDLVPSPGDYINDSS